MEATRAIWFKKRTETMWKHAALKSQRGGGVRKGGIPPFWERIERGEKKFSGVGMGENKKK